MKNLGLVMVLVSLQALLESQLYDEAKEIIEKVLKAAEEK